MRNSFGFQAAAITSDILETLGRDGHFTLFAPTNEAFEKLPRGVLERIMGDKVASEGRKIFPVSKISQKFKMKPKRRRDPHQE